MGLASSGDGERICEACACQMRQRPAGRRSASGQCLEHHIQLLTCKRMLPCESMCGGGEACTRAACVSSVLCTRVLVCKAQRGERGRGGGEAEASEAGARPCKKIFCLENGKMGKWENARRVHRIGKPRSRAAGGWGEVGDWRQQGLLATLLTAW